MADALHGPHWLPLLIVLPLAVAIVAFLGRRPAATLGPVLTLLLALLALAAARLTLAGPWTYSLGGWAPPLGIAWRLDGLSAVMLLLTALIGLCGALYGRRSFTVERQARYFWPLWLLLLAAMNGLFLAADLFTLYVTLEFMALAAVALVALAGQGQALHAAMRYLLGTLLGSMIYLLGVALLYGGHGQLDLGELATRLQADDAVAALAAALISVGLLLKAAAFPLHFWLPAAHSRAPVPVSAILSGAVVAAAFYLLVRLWLGPFAVLLNGASALLLGLLGVAAIFWGGLQALHQRRLKLMIAYSTISQLGFGMLLFPLLALDALPELAWRGALLVVFAHGLAKAALFLAAGCIAHHCGHDRIDQLHGASRQPWPWLAFALASASLIGLPPSGGFAGKWLLLQAALAVEAWGWVLAMLAGTVLTAAYLLRVLEQALRPAPAGCGAATAAEMQSAALLPALAAALLGLLLIPLGSLLAVGAPALAGG